MVDRQARRAARFDETMTLGERRAVEIDATAVGYVDLRDDEVSVTVRLETPDGTDRRDLDAESVTVEGPRSLSVTITPGLPGVYRLRVFVDDGDSRLAVPRDGAITIWVEPQ